MGEMILNRNDLEFQDHLFMIILVLIMIPFHDQQFMINKGFSMSISDLAALVGRVATYSPRVGGDGALHVLVEIVDVKAPFGRPTVRIKPQAGHGEQWVALDSIVLAENVRVP